MGCSALVVAATTFYLVNHACRAKAKEKERAEREKAEKEKEAAKERERAERKKAEAAKKGWFDWLDVLAQGL